MIMQATMVGLQGCQDGVMVPPPLSLWQPTALDTDSWVATCKAMGGSRIIYVAKHGCGFAAWRSKTDYKYVQ
jgi:alpha-L-fucosidase